MLIYCIIYRSNNLSITSLYNNCGVVKLQYINVLEYYGAIKMEFAKKMIAKKKKN